MRFGATQHIREVTRDTRIPVDRLPVRASSNDDDKMGTASGMAYYVGRTSPVA